jgi:hypothetical protein
VFYNPWRRYRTALQPTPCTALKSLFCYEGVQVLNQFFSSSSASAAVRQPAAPCRPPTARVCSLDTLLWYGARDRTPAPE